MLTQIYTPSVSHAGSGQRGGAEDSPVRSAGSDRVGDVGADRTRGVSFEGVRDADQGSEAGSSVYAQLLENNQEFMRVQADSLRKLVETIATKPSDGRHSVFRVNPNVHWPTMGDDDDDPDKFNVEFDRVCGLANDGRGLIPSEKLLALGHCLKGSRKENYDLIVSAATKTGLVDENPEAVLESILSELQEYKEEILAKQCRLEEEWTSGPGKGKLTALQYKPKFQTLCLKLDAAGIGKSEREKYLCYLRRIGQYWRSQVLVHLLISTDDAGNQVLKRPGTWQECHKALRQLEDVHGHGKALQAAILPDGSPKKGKDKAKGDNPKGKGGAKGTTAKGGPDKGGGKGGSFNAYGNQTSTEKKQSYKEMLASLPDHLKQVCLTKVNTGKCEREGCTYDHSKKLVLRSRSPQGARTTVRSIECGWASSGSSTTHIGA